MPLKSEVASAVAPEPMIGGHGLLTDVRAFGRNALLFIVIGVMLYVGVYAASELVLYHHAKRNRFYLVKTAPFDRYDDVILGASHAAALDYEDMTARLEQMTGSRILNLSIVGGGITVNRLTFDYFLARHSTGTILYVIDSFAFYSPEWNEGRLQDVRLFYRAPFDPALARLLLRSPATRRTALDYILGFSKINNPDRFKPDIDESEATRFNRTYRPIKQIDQQRMDYLYPAKAADASSSLAQYLAEFEDLIRHAKSLNIRFVVVKPPIPARVYRAIPREKEFDTALKAVLDRQGVAFHDFSLSGNDEKFFLDTDHLNRTGVLNFFENYLKGVVAAPIQGGHRPRLEISGRS